MRPLLMYAVRTSQQPTGAPGTGTANTPATTASPPYYPACTTCLSKLVPQPSEPASTGDPPYTCTKCRASTPSAAVSHRYKLSLLVAEAADLLPHSRSRSHRPVRLHRLTLFGDTVQSLTGVRADTLAAAVAHGRCSVDGVMAALDVVVGGLPITVLLKDDMVRCERGCWTVDTRVRRRAVGGGGGGGDGGKGGRHGWADATEITSSRMDVVCSVSTRLCDLVDVGDRAGDGDGAVPDQHEGGDDNDRQSEASEASEASEGWDLDPSLIAAALDDNNDDGVNAAQVPGAGKDGDEDKSGGSNTKGVRKVVSFDEYEFDDDAFEDAAFLAALEAASAASFLPAAVADLWALDTPTPTDSRDAASSPDLFENDTQTVPDAAFLWHDTDTDADSDGTDAEPDADDYFAYLTQRFQQQQQPRHAADPTDSQSTALSQSTLLSQPLSQPLSQICMPTHAKVMGRDALAQMLTQYMRSTQAAAADSASPTPLSQADPTADQVAALLDGLSLADFQDDLDDTDDTEQSHVSHGQPPEPDDDDTDDEAEWSKYDNVDSVLEMIGLRINRLNVSSHDPA